MEITVEASERMARIGIRIPAGHWGMNLACQFEAPISLVFGGDMRNAAKIGAFTYSHTRLSPYVEEIGRYCSIANSVTFGDMEHPTNWISTSNFTYDRHWWADFEQGSGFNPEPLPTNPERSTIKLGNDVWVGARAYIKKGVKIGTGAIIGADAVVTKDVPPYAIVVGNPGVVKRYRFPEEIIERLIASCWWRYKYTDFKGMQISNVDAFLDDLEKSNISSYNPGFVTLSDLVSSTIKDNNPGCNTDNV